MSEYAIVLDHIWKIYPVQKDRPGFKEFFVHFHKFIGKKRKQQSHFCALKGVSLQVQKGECVGIIGRNGAGKSTLLSILLGTTLPTKGSVTVMDGITPLLELGGGFHPELTGRENVILNGVLLGLRKEEVLERMPPIIDFSELDEFIDFPVRTYSSGMYVRLAFSVAIHARPRILVIDEILSVGDEGFQKKSKEALLKMIRNGVTTVFVSHNLRAVEEICSRVLWLEHGEVILDGNPTQVIEEYRNAMIPRLDHP